MAVVELLTAIFVQHCKRTLDLGFEFAESGQKTASFEVFDSICLVGQAGASAAFGGGQVGWGGVAILLCTLDRVLRAGG